MRRLTSVLAVMAAMGTSTVVMFADLLVPDYWPPAEGGQCTKTVGECSKTWECPQPGPLICVRQSYVNIPSDGPCRYRARRTHDFDPVQCYYDPDTGTYGCFAAVKVTPVYDWEAHPGNPANCPSVPDVPPPDAVLFGGPNPPRCAVVEDRVSPLGNLCD